MIETAPIKIFRDYNLKPHNTMGLSVYAAYFTTVTSMEELNEALNFAEAGNLRTLFLGGGSNLLFVNNFDGIVIRIDIKREQILYEDDTRILVKVSAGEEWHAFVIRCVDRGWGGVENLSLIPGSAGAAPIQNIGAYGVELKNVLHSVQYMDIETRKIIEISNTECRFGYRDSIFKNELRNKAVIISLAIELHKQHQVNVGYKALAEYLEERNIAAPTIKQVSDAVIEIRRSKLPDPTEIANTGSFFKNPVISAARYEKLKYEFPGIPSYPAGHEKMKIPAAWLIDQAGWKGKRIGDAGMHRKQALVLVNYGSATGKELWDFARIVQADIFQKFGIELKPEVNVVE